MQTVRFEIVPAPTYVPSPLEFKSGRELRNERREKDRKIKKSK